VSVPFTWQNRVNAALELVELRRPESPGAPRVSFRSPALPRLRLAAARRDVTVSTLARRASLAVAAQILGHPFEDLCAADPTLQRPGFAPVPDPSGRLGGPWAITGFKDPMG
jgi:hypothetical protein